MKQLSKHDVGLLCHGSRVRVGARLATVVSPHEPQWIDHNTKAFTKVLQGADVGFDDEPTPLGVYVHVADMVLLDEADECTHEIVEYGCCAGCGIVLDSMWLEAAYPHLTPADLSGCQGRGWYHDGSEQEDAIKTGRIPKPCPYCNATKP